MTILATDRSATTHKCPRCGNLQVSRAHRANSWDRVLSLVNIYPYRCRQHHCKTRFHRFGRSI